MTTTKQEKEKKEKAASINNEHLNDKATQKLKLFCS